MKVQIKKQDCNNISFDSIIRAAIFGIGSMTYTEKVDLYNKTGSLKHWSYITGKTKRAKPYINDLIKAGIVI